MKAATVLFTTIFLLFLNFLGAQNTASNTCDIYIGTYFSPNCNLDTCMYGAWGIRYSEGCGITKLKFTVYDQAYKKRIYQSDKAWNGMKEKTGDYELYYPSGYYPYEIVFYKTDKTMIRKKGKVFLYTG